MQKKWTKTFKEYGEALLIALVLAFFIRSFVVQAFKIPSGSMKDTLLIGDHLLVNKFIYGVKIPFSDKTIVPISKPEFQDIVVFNFPVDGSTDFIKRVIGLPGDTIEIKDKKVYRNEKLLQEPYAQHTSRNIIENPRPRTEWPPDNPYNAAYVRDNLGPVQVPQDKYFVMGDNRDESFDSRFWGFVEEEAIIGEAWIIYWSWESMGLTTIRWDRIGDIIE